MRVVPVLQGVCADSTDKKIHARNRIVIVFGKKMEAFNFAGISHVHSGARAVMRFFPEENMSFILE